MKTIKSGRLFILLLIATSVSAQSNHGINNDSLLVYFQSQEYEKAINYLQHVSDNPTSAAYLAYAYYMDGELNQAVKIYQRLWQKDSLNINTNVYLGNIYYKKENYHKTLRYYHLLAELRPQNFNYIRQLGFLYDNLTNTDSSFKYICRAYQLNPYDAQTVSRLGDYWIGKEKYSEADSLFIPYLQYDSANASIISGRISSAYQQQEYQAVTLLGRRLINMDDASYPPLLYLLLSYYHTNQYDSCLSVCNYLFVHKFRTEPVLYYAAQCYAKKYQFTKSNEYLRECLGKAISKNADAYYAAMVDNYLQMKMYRPAVARNDTAYYIFHNPMRLYSIATIYDSYLQMPTKARVFYKKFLRKCKPCEENEKINEYVKMRLNKLSKKE